MSNMVLLLLIIHGDELPFTIIYSFDVAVSSQVVVEISETNKDQTIETKRGEDGWRDGKMVPKCSKSHTHGAILYFCSTCCNFFAHETVPVLGADAR